MSVEAMNIALTGLRTAKLALDVTSNNISNANVEGYTRKSLPISSVVNRDTGNVFGVRGEVVRRSFDPALRRDLWLQTSRESFLATRTDYLNKVQVFHGASDSGNSISSVINGLEQSFIELSSSPDDPLLQQNIVNAAQLTAQKFNDFGSFIVNTRNDIQNDIQSSVDSINSILDNIASLNRAIKSANSSGRTTANLEDERDIAVRNLNELVEVSSYTRADGVLVVQVGSGTIISEDTPEEFFFQNRAISVTGDPGSVFLNDATGTDLGAIGLGGRLGALLELRDETLPEYQAQIDELSHKLSLRFEEQGMRLFTGRDGTVPGTAPADYIGYAVQMQVNDDIVNDPTLVRDGTVSTIEVTEASSNVVQKILDFTFGTTQAVTASGTANMLAAPTLQAALGIQSQAQLAGTEDITALGVLADDPNITGGQGFTIRVGTNPPQNINISAGQTATDLLNTINAAFGPELNAVIGPNGQLGIEANNDITIGLGTMSPAGLAALGLETGVVEAQDPSFTVQLSTGTPTTISIPPGYTAGNLLTDLNAIPGLTASLGAGNVLELEPTHGGDLVLSNITGDPVGAMGISYDSIQHEEMQTTGLGADGTIESRVATADKIGDYARRMINIHSSDYSDAERSTELEGDYRNLLEKTIKDQFGVDIDQEMAQLIQIQTSYSAAARVVSASQELFSELLDAF